MKSKKGYRFIALAFAGVLGMSTVLSGCGSIDQDKEKLQEEEKFEEEERLEEEGRLAAFPGAEGGGKYVTGGRGGDVYVVTSLADNGTPGTLRYGIENAPAEGRIIVFNVGGTIHLTKRLSIDKSGNNITIAGQTAPGDGITIAGYDTNISNSDNVIIQYVRFRVGTENLLTGGGDSFDALWGRDNTNFIIDHCSFSWNTDETLSLYRGKNGTVQWCIISESLTVSGHTKGRHGYGGIFGGENVVFQYNLMADHTSRNPRIGGGSMGDPSWNAPSYGNLQVSNNVVYNWGFNTIYGGGWAYTNYINNYAKSGQGTRDSVENLLLDAGEKGKPGGFYVDGNVMEGNPGITADNSKGIRFSGEKSGQNETVIAAEPYEQPGFHEITLVSAEEAYKQVIAKAGAIFPHRDAIDARVIAEVLSDNGRYINTEFEVGGYPAEDCERPAGFDSDLDGIEDAWELANGLDPTDPADSAKIADSGYAYIEEYYHSLVEDALDPNYAAQNPDIDLSVANNAQYDKGEAIDITVNVKAWGSDENQVFGNTITGLEPGTYDIIARAYDSEGNTTDSSAVKVHVNSTDSAGEWISQDIGEPGIPGSASLTDGVLTVKGAGKLGRSEGTGNGTGYSAKSESRWSTPATDNFQYTYRKFNGDGEITVKLDYVTMVDNHAFSGIMFRESTDDNAKAAALGLSVVKADSYETCWAAYMVNRPATGGDMSYIGDSVDSLDAAGRAGIPIVPNLNFKDDSVYHGIWLRLMREGDTFTGYVSEDKEIWTKVGSLTVDMAEEILVGFAVDGNKVANGLDNLNTSRFSDINVSEGFEGLYSVQYDLEHLDAKGLDHVQKEAGLTVIFTPEKDYVIPENIEVTMGGKKLTDGEDYTYESDKKSAVLTIPKVTGTVVVKGAGAAWVDDSVYELEVVDPHEFLTMTTSEDGTVITLRQEAPSGDMSVKPGAEKDRNVSYVLFPESDKYQSMTLTLKVKERLLNSSKTGVYVGAFLLEDPSWYVSWKVSNKEATDAVGGYWVKSMDADGNYANVGGGSPKLSWTESDEYQVTFTRLVDDKTYAFTAQWSDPSGQDMLQDGSAKVPSATKQYKISEQVIKPGDDTRLGFALIGVEVEITNLMLVNEDGEVLYEQPRVDGLDTLSLTGEDETTPPAGVMTLADSKETDQAVQNTVTKVKLYIYNGKTLVDVIVLSNRTK